MTTARRGVLQDRLLEVLVHQGDEVLAAWTRHQEDLLLPGRQPTAPRAEAEQVLAALTSGLESGLPLERLAYEDDCLRGCLIELAERLAADGAQPSTAALTILALKQAIVTVVRAHDAGPDQVDLVMALNRCVDAAAVLILEHYVQRRDDLIAGQQQRMLELSAPLLTVAPGVLVLPLIGAFDAERAQTALDNTLEAIHASLVRTLVLDLTGATVMDAVVTERLVQIVAAARLLGTESAISGVRAETALQLAQHRDRLTGIRTYATLADALASVSPR